MRTQFDTTPVVTLVAGLAGASSYASTDISAAADLHDLHAQISTELRLAQVELYCDHDTLALHAIQRARHQLQAQADVATTRELVALDEAAWHVRHHELGAAVATLDAARLRLAS